MLLILNISLPLKGMPLLYPLGPRFYSIPGELKHDLPVLRIPVSAQTRRDPECKVRFRAIDAPSGPFCLLGTSQPKRMLRANDTPQKKLDQ
jgi:hypothetical protein